MHMRHALAHYLVKRSRFIVMWRRGVSSVSAQNFSRRWYFVRDDIFISAS